MHKTALTISLFLDSLLKLVPFANTNLFSNALAEWYNGNYNNYGNSYYKKIK